jgi:hypothetical protein
VLSSSIGLRGTVASCAFFGLGGEMSSADEIEVTPEMRRAGQKALNQYFAEMQINWLDGRAPQFSIPKDLLVERIYRAMRIASEPDIPFDEMKEYLEKAVLPMAKRRLDSEPPR